MPGQFINKGTNPEGKVSLINSSDSGNLKFSTAGGGGGGFSATVDIIPTPYCLSSPIDSFLVTGDGSTFCNSTQFTASNFSSLPPGDISLKYGLDQVTVTLDGTNVAVLSSLGCYQCG